MALVIDQDGIFRKVRYKPHDGQVKIHAAKADHRFRAVSAGRRTGKSTSGGHELTVEAHKAYAMRSMLEPKGRRKQFWIVGPEYSDAEKEFRTLYNDCIRLQLPMDHPGTYYSEDGSDLRLSLWGGRFIVDGKSAKYPKTLVGEGLDGVIMVEAAKLKEQVWIKYVRPTLADYAAEGSWGLFTSTPEGKNWFYRLWQRGQSTDPLDAQWWSMRAPSWSNNIVFPGGRFDPEILEMERDMSKEKFNQEIGADFTEFVGRVFKDFDEELHVGDFPYNPRWPLYVAEDAGFRNPSVALFIQVDIWDNVWVVGEYYERERIPEDFAKDVLNDSKLGPLSRVATKLYPDPADPGTAATLEKYWGVKSQGGTGGELKDRLDLIRKWLRPQPFELEDGHPEKVPKLMIDRSCTNLIREMLDYRYPDSKEEANSTEPEKPLKEDDHAPEALGRFFAGHFAKQEKENYQRRVSKARIGGRRA